MSVKYLVGDVFDRMAELEDGSVDLILTSPPFLALRSYLPADHPDKDKEIGSEPTPAEFVDTLLRLSAEWRRLLTPHGSICVELGDTFAGSGGSGGDYNENGLREGQPQFRQMASREHRPEREGTGADGGPRTVPTNGGRGWPLAKSLTLTPEAYRFALAYGINPHTGTKSPAGQWRVRNVVRWVRPNPPVGALGDKFRPATSELVVAAVSKDRWFDLDAVREPYAVATEERNKPGSAPRGIWREGRKENDTALTVAEAVSTHAGAPPLDWWKISPKGYAGAHYAVWPSELCVKPIKAMCPREVCRDCGQPRRRITEPNYVGAKSGQPYEAHVWASSVQDGKAAHTAKRPDEGARSLPKTVGWSDCGHDNWRPGLVLDPFAGTGTTLAVAHGHSRDAIGIDIDERNADLARERVGGLFLEVVL